MADRSAMRALMRELAESNKLAKAQNLSQLSNSSIEDGAIDEYDADGNLTSRLGAQHDGTHAAVTLAGPPPPTPAGFTCTGGQLAATAVWDGRWVDGAVAPMDFARVEVHASTSGPDFVVDPMPMSGTRVGTIETAAGAGLTFSAFAGQLWVKLTARAQSGKVSEQPTEAIEVEVSAAVDQAELEHLQDELDAAQGQLDQARTDLDQAQHDLYEPGGTVDMVKTTLTGQITSGDQATAEAAATDAAQKAAAAQAAATAASAADAQAKADAANAAAQAAAKTYADTVAAGASAAAIAAAAADAQQKADAAKAAGLAAAAAAQQAADAAAALAGSKGRTWVQSNIPNVITRTNLARNPSMKGTLGTVYTQLNATLSFVSQSGAARGTALLVMPSGASVDSAAYVDGGPGALRSGMVAGKTYTISALITSSGNANANNGNGNHCISVFYRTGTTGGYTLVKSPSVVGTAAQRVSVTVTIPSGTTEAFIRLYNGGSTGTPQVTFADLLIEEGPTAGVFFDGATAADTLNVYGWTGTAELSNSTAGRATDLWIDTTGGANSPKRWNGTSWVAVTDKVATDAAAAAAAAQQAANTASGKADAAQTTASGKNKIFWFQTDAVDTTPGTTVGDLWRKYAVVNNVLQLLAEWRWDGAHWVSQALSETFLPQVNIGTGTYGELDGIRLKAQSVQANTILVAGSVNTTVIADGAITSTKIVAQDIAGAVATFIQLNVDQITATGSANFASAVVDKMFANIFAAHQVTADQIDAASIAAAVGTFVKVKAENVLAGNVTVALNIAAGGKITAGNAEMGNGFKTYGVNATGDRFVNTQMGVPGSPDSWSLTDADGDEVASISQLGDFSGNSLSVDTDIFIQGIPIAGRLINPAGPLGFADLLSRGTRARPNFRTAVSGLTIQPGGSVSGVGQFAVDLSPGRTYRFSMPWRGYIARQGTNTMVDVTLRMFMTQASGPGATAPDPTVNDTNIGQQSIVYPSMGTGVDDVLAFEFDAPARDDGQNIQFKFLLGLWAQYGTFAPDVTNLMSTSTWVGTLEDIGATPFAVPVTVPGAGTITQYVTTWAATDSHAWLPDGSRYDTGAGSRPAAGSILLQGGGLPGNHSAVVFNGAAVKGEAKTIAQAFAGATIVRLEVFLYQTWVEDTDQAQVEVRKWTGTTLPTTQAPPPSTQTGITKHYYTARSQGAWFDIPTSYISGTQTGLWIASPDWAAPNAHSNLGGATATNTGYRPLLRATYNR